MSERDRFVSLKPNTLMRGIATSFVSFISCRFETIHAA